MAVFQQTLGSVYHEMAKHHISVLIALMVCWLLTKLYRYFSSPLSHIPGPWYSPLTTLHLRYAFATGTIWKLVENAHDIYGPVFRLGPRQIWVSDKNAMKQILSQIDLPKVNMYAEISRDPLSPGLFGEVRAEPHKRLKRFLAPAFTVAYVDDLRPLFVECVKSLMVKYDKLLTTENPKGSLKSWATIDLMNDLHCLALDIMGECSFGRGFGQLDFQGEGDLGLSGEETLWRQIPDAIFSGMKRRYQMVYLKRFLRNLGLDLQFDWPSHMIQAIRVIMNTRATNSDTTRPDLLQHMIDNGTRPDTNLKMNPRDVIDQMSEILLAGSETTSGTLACLFLELCRNPCVKEKLLSSLPILAPDGPLIDGKAIRQDESFRYLNACIKENLRLHPIASEMGRKTESWHDIAGYMIPPKTVVSASYRHLHRNPEFWQQSLRFWPERWLDGHERHGAPPPDMDAYYPFSAGSHSCIGKNFAWAEMGIVAANLLSRFDFEEVRHQDIDYRQYITMQFKTGSWKVIVRPRYEA